MAAPLCSTFFCTVYTQIHTPHDYTSHVLIHVVSTNFECPPKLLSCLFLKWIYDYYKNIENSKREQESPTNE